MSLALGLRTALLAAGLSLALAAPSAGQEPRQQPGAAPADTVGTDSVPVSARGAFLRSLAIPGWGQAYVQAPGRGVVYFAAESGSLWMWYKSRRQLAAARELEATMRESGQLTAEQPSPLVRARESQVEDWFFLSAFILLFSGADAYVTAQLRDFDDNIGVQPGGDGSIRLEARVPFPRHP